MKKQSIGVGLMGLGVIGGQVARVLTDKEEILSGQVGCPLVLRKIKVIEADLDRPQVKEMDPKLFTVDDEEFFGPYEFLLHEVVQLLLFHLYVLP